MGNETDRDGAGAAPSEPRARKPYTVPALRVYGDVATLTHAVGMVSTHSDGGAMFNKSKTH
jgi:hypothetical protein